MICSLITKRQELEGSYCWRLGVSIKTLFLSLEPHLKKELYARRAASVCGTLFAIAEKYKASKINFRVRSSCLLKNYELFTQLGGWVSKTSLFSNKAVVALITICAAPVKNDRSIVVGTSLDL